MTSAGRVVAALASLVLGVAGSGCGHAVLGRPIPSHGLHVKPSDFVPNEPDVAVLHYYGVGGWGILWHGSYLLTAPYFSNHGYVASSVGAAVPDRDAIRDGFANTPIDKTKVILVGHGHVDHASDIPAYPFGEMPHDPKPTLIADESTIHQLGDATRERVCSIGLRSVDGAVTVPTDGICSTSVFRIRALPWAHAPHLRIDSTAALVTYGDPQGTQTADLVEPPARGGDWLVGPTWAFLIELLGDDGKPVFRIHYVDAAANPNFAERHAAPSDPVDVHIGCVPDFDLVEGYPAEVIGRYDVKYVLAGHWEDFFRDRKRSLEPVVGLDDEKMGEFVSRVEGAIVSPVCGSGPINKTDCRVGEDCGPAGESWTVPVPGETFWFRTSQAAGKVDADTSRRRVLARMTSSAP